MRTTPAPGGGTGRGGLRGRRLRWALCAATMLAPLGGVALIAVAQRGGGGFAPMSPVGEALAQSLPPQDDAARPFSLAAAPETADADTGGAFGVLLQQANFWRERQRYDQALSSLNRALKLLPDNPDALALLAQLQTEKGDQQAAAAALARLKQAAPGDPRIEKIDAALRLGPISPEQLAEARRLAQSGKQTEALERYNRVFKGNPPPDALAVEYYQTLAGAEGGYDQAKEGLARLVRQTPQDLRAQLAYAQVLTYRDAGRLEGVQRLAALAQNPAVAEPATQAWRQALGWLPDNEDSAEPIQTYLASHPNDVEVANKLARTKGPAPAESPLARARILGFDAFNKGDLENAARLFLQAIEGDATDADATGGLGLVRLRQHNLADAKTLLARAIALDPEHRGRWQSALTAASATPGGGPNPALAMINRGDLAAAQREISRQAAEGADVAGLQAMLADVQARQGRLEEAEATYRAALARAPRNPQVLVGLAGVLSRQGRGEEASDLLDRAQAAGGNSRLVGQARALQLREQANAITDPATKVGLYRAAVAADPDNPWLRLDLARALFKRGATQEAREVMAGVIGATPTTDALKAGIIFANETSDPDAAASLIARLPPALRTPDMLTLQVQAEMQREIGAALLLSRPVARLRLLALAERPDPDGARGAAVARALGAIGDTAAAREAVLTAQASTPGQGAGARLRYAGALLDAGDAQGAQDMLAAIGPARRLSAGERQDFTRLQAGLAVRASDRLNEQGRQADAYDHLAPLLARAPESPDLNLALARLYQGARNPREALQISETLLRRDRRNIEARKAAVEAALQLRDRVLADQLVREGQELSPNDPRTWMMSAELERDRGNNGRALRELERARELRLQQLGYSNADTGADTAPPGYAPPAYQPAAPPSPFRPAFPNADGGADQPEDLAVPPLVQDHAPPPAQYPPVAPPQYQPFGAQPAVPPAAAAIRPGPFSSMPAPAVDTAQGYYANPFREGPGTLPGETDALPAAGAAAPDAQTEEIDKSIVALRDALAPSVQIGFGVQNRSGQSGLDQLSDFTVPMEATFAPGGTGQLKVQVTPVVLTSGTVGGSAVNQQQFGSNALSLASTLGVVSLDGTRQPDQHAAGLGLDVGYSLRSLSADIGSSPFGFEKENVVGGVEWAPRITDRVRLRLLAERRAMTDSVLSYAGTTDPRSGQKWGGVVKNHARATVEISAGRADFYVLGGGAQFSGAHVQSNAEIEAGAGGSFPVYRAPGQEIRVGLDLIYFGYTHNQDFFTLGQGGYFSPQSFIEAMVPVVYKETVDEDLSYELGASAGYASFRESPQPYFPLDPGLQAQLIAQQEGANAVPGALSENAGRSVSGFAGTAHATADYRLSPSLHLGARLSYEHSPAYDQTTAAVYAKYLFNGADK